MTIYRPCPNGCSGEVPLVVECFGSHDDPYYAGIDDEANATSHDDDCPPLTVAQIAKLEDDATVYAGSMEYLDAEAERMVEP